MPGRRRESSQTDRASSPNGQVSEPSGSWAGGRRRLPGKRERKPSALPEKDAGNAVRYSLGAMDQESIIQYVEAAFPGVEVQRPDDGPGAGDTFFFYDPDRNIDPSRRLPFATIVVKDYAGWDESSILDRPGVFRLNIGVGRTSFIALFGHPPSEQIIKAAGYDFAKLDQLMPHPTYGSQSWVCVLNPSPETFENVKPLLADAYSIVEARHAGKPGQV